MFVDLTTLGQFMGLIFLIFFSPTLYPVKREITVGNAQ